MRILISGAGIAGLTAAYWLKRYGFTPTIVERAPSLPIGGYKIDVRGTALQVLRRMGIEDAVIKASTDMQGALLVDKEGNIINKMTGDAFGHRVGEDLEIIRGALCQILMDTIPDVEFIFDDCIQAITQVADGVNIQFQNNKPRKFDWVIGADGIHSNVRQLVFGDESRFSRELGLYLCVFTVPNYLNLDRIEMQYSELGRVAALWSARGEENMKACFGFTSPHPIDLHDVAAKQQALKTIYKGINWEIPKLLQMMPDATDFYFDTAAQIVMNRWSEGRVVLLGDAAFCASPMSGQGTSLALIGAYVLAGELASAKDAYQTAFNQYEQEMREFVNSNQELGLQAAKLMRSQEKHNGLAGFFTRLMSIVPSCVTGWCIQFFINRATKRISKAANSIHLKDYGV